MTKSELVKPPDSAASADASPPPAAAQQYVATPSLIATPTGTASIENDSAPSARLARGRGEPQRPTAASRVPRSSGPRPPAQVPLTGPAVSAPSRRGLVAEPLAPVPPASPEPAANSIGEQFAPLPLQAGSQGAPHGLASEPAEYPASRLSGLRNLLVSLGRRSLNQENELQDAPTHEIEPRVGRVAVRAAYGDSVASEDGAGDNGVSGLLSAEPEFLRPGPNAEIEKEKEKEPVRPTPPRRDTPEGEEIQTLPSWRGQYRKKRYPPI